jgi:hypothetical protein
MLSLGQLLTVTLRIDANILSLERKGCRQR